MYFAPDGSSTESGAVLVEINKRIKRDLVLAADRASLYAMTQDKVGPWGPPEEGPRGSRAWRGADWRGRGQPSSRALTMSLSTFPTFETVSVHSVSLWPI